jgi:hypothetical protein
MRSNRTPPKKNPRVLPLHQPSRFLALLLTDLWESCGIHSEGQGTGTEWQGTRPFIIVQRGMNISGLGNREYCRRDPSCWPRGTLYQQKLTLTSLTSRCPSVGIVRSRTQATEFVLFVLWGMNITTSQIVVYWSAFLPTDPGVPGSIPGATRFSEK